jgi:hypothetical protein
VASSKKYPPPDSLKQPDRIACTLPGSARRFLVVIRVGARPEVGTLSNDDNASYDKQDRYAEDAGDGQHVPKIPGPTPRETSAASTSDYPSAPIAGVLNVRERAGAYRTPRLGS